LSVSNKVPEDLSWIFDEVKSHSGSLSKAIIAITISNIFQVFSTLFVMAVYNKVIPNESMNTLFSLGTGICVILTFDLLFKIVKSKLADDMCSEIEEKLGPRLYQKILAWDLQNVPKASGQSSTLTKDLDQVIELFTSSTITSCVNVPFILVNLAVIYLIGGSIVIVPVVIATLIFINCLVSYLRTKSSAEPLKKTSIDKTSAFLETISNLETLKSIGDYSYFEKKWGKISAASKEISQKLRGISSTTNSTSQYLIALNQISVVSMGAWLVTEKEMSSGALIAAVLLSSKALQPVLQIGGLLSRFALAKESLSRLSGVFNRVSAEEARRQNISIKSITAPIILDAVEFVPQGLNRSLISVERLRIKHGEKVGIIGSVGSGKSTFLKLIAGVLTPTSGQIRFGEFDINAISQSDLRRHVAFVGQNAGIFGGTIRENLLLGNDSISDEEIIELAQLTGLTNVLRSLPNGLSFEMSENGKELSGGQKQILAIARAFASHPNYLFLDEPTSAMDPKSERLFVNNMAKYSSDKTLIVVTHRKPILTLTDRLLLIEHGNIVLDGPKDEVLKKLS
jgi:ATP-binding cassette subfamily C protein LapB